MSDETKQPEIQDWHREAARELSHYFGEEKDGKPLYRKWDDEGRYFNQRDDAAFANHYESLAAIIARHAPPPETVNADLVAIVREIDTWYYGGGDPHISEDLLNRMEAALMESVLEAAEGRRNG